MQDGDSAALGDGAGDLVGHFSYCRGSVAHRHRTCGPPKHVNVVGAVAHRDRGLRRDAEADTKTFKGSGLGRSRSGDVCPVAAGRGDRHAHRTERVEVSVDPRGPHRNPGRGRGAQVGDRRLLLFAVELSLGERPVDHPAPADVLDADLRLRCESQGALDDRAGVEPASILDHVPRWQGGVQADGQRSVGGHGESFDQAEPGCHGQEADQGPARREDGFMPSGTDQIQGVDGSGGDLAVVAEERAIDVEGYQPPRHHRRHLGRRCRCSIP